MPMVLLRVKVLSQQQPLHRLALLSLRLFRVVTMDLEIHLVQLVGLLQDHRTKGLLVQQIMICGTRHAFERFVVNVYLVLNKALQLLIKLVY